MARADLTLVVSMPDARPQDVTDLREAGDALWFTNRELADRLHLLADRIGRALLTAGVTTDPDAHGR